MPDEAHMRLTRRALLAAGAALPLAVGRSLARKAPLLDTVRSSAEALLERDSIPGAAAVLLLDGEPAWQQTFGSTRATSGKPIDLHTIFSLQSCSKNFTATLAMLAVQKGLVDLDKPVTTYLPDFTVNSRHEDAPQTRMSVRMLLNHHAGFTHEAPIGNNFTDAPWTFDTHIRSIHDTWLRYPVGERYSYSNLGMNVAARILERVSGRSYDQCLRAWLLASLGMMDTTADPDVYEARANRAIGHQPGIANLPVRIPLLGSGGVYSSITDMARYAAFHLNEGRIGNRHLLDTQLWREMHDLRYASNYALGVGCGQGLFSKPGIRVYGHNGGGFGFACSFSFCKSEGIAWIVLSNGNTKPVSNTNPFDGILHDPVLKSRNIVAMPAPPPDRPSIAVPIATLQRWVGSYVNDDTYVDVTIEEGALRFRRRGDSAPNTLTFTAPNEAWISDGPMRPQAILFFESQGLEVQRFKTADGAHWDFNDGPSVTNGPVGTEYDAKLGTYAIDMFGTPIAQATLSRRNGYLYFNDIRATPYEPGLLFGGSGEALDLRGPVPMARNIPLRRLADAPRVTRIESLRAE